MNTKATKTCRGLRGFWGCLHRFLYWKQISTKIGSGCQGDWREVVFYCKRCNQNIEGSTQVSYEDEKNPLTEWKVLK